MRQTGCPYCGGARRETKATGVLHCDACGRSSLREADGAAPGEPGAARETGRAEAGPAAAVPRLTGRGAPGEVPSGPALVQAIALSALLYGVLALLPAGRIGELFTARGWVPVVITGLSAWALCLLAARLGRLRRERALLARDWLGAPLSATRLDRDAARRAIERLEGLPERERESFVVGRLLRTLRHFALRPRVGEVVEFLASESRADEGRVEASYALVRVFVWAVPTLGFIGTVIGIGAAVAGFSETLEAAASLEGMKESIGSVTSGLGVAFDTTLLALVMSILIMFPASAVQRFEEGLLAAVDDYCAEALVGRLAEEPTTDPDGEGLVERLAERLVEAMAAARRDPGSPSAAG